jgi:transposase
LYANSLEAASGSPLSSLFLFSSFFNKGSQRIMEDYMVVVGFDVGKDSLFGARLDRSGQVKERYELENNKATLLPALQHLRATYKHLLVASEATAEYHRPLAELCLDLNIPFRLLNPLTTKQFTRATVRKKKTDKTDAEVIARVALQGEGTVVTRSTFNDTKPMARTGARLAQAARRLHLMQQHLVTVLPNEAQLHTELGVCEERLLTASETFRATARSRVSPETSLLLQSIPGIGPATATLLIAELGDITRFRDAKAVVAYIGLDPRVRQSGISLQRNTKLTKRGSPYMRQALYLAAASAKRHDPECEVAFERKRAEGKRYKEATIVVARKLIARVYAVWKRGTPYVPRIA